MTPDQINTWTDAALRMQNAVDVYGPGLILASCTVTAWWACRWVARTAFRCWDRLVERRQLRHTPAAFDNQPPVDDDTLATCRRIARQPLTDPDISRTAHRYLRQKGDEQ